MEIAPVSFDPAAAFEIKADRAAKAFEAFVVSQMLAPMFATVGTSALFGGGEGEKAFSSLLHEEFAKTISERGGFGIADEIKAEIIRLQAATAAPPTGEHEP